VYREEILSLSLSLLIAKANSGFFFLLHHEEQVEIAAKREREKFHHAKMKNNISRNGWMLLEW
jgi:hypothetical protein